MNQIRELQSRHQILRPSTLIQAHTYPGTESDILTLIDDNLSGVLKIAVQRLTHVTRESCRLHL